MSTRKRPALWNDVFQLRVTLMGIEPAIWRRMTIPALYCLSDLHDVLQIAFEWTNSHLHQFEIGDVRIGMADVTEDLLVADERRAPLGAVAYVGSIFTYEYDFGDGWEHEIVVEEHIGGKTAQLPQPVCLAGARAHPPEDCGGVGGYERLLEVLADPDHEEHDEMRVWVGKRYDPERFDLVPVNRRLATLGKRIERRLLRPTAPRIRQ